jgi:branched-chain amino acid transport system substrate-binding protein
MRFDRATAIGMVAVCMVLLAGPARSQVQPYQIDVIISLSGPGAFLGKNQSASLGVVEASVNKSGGVAGRPIHFNIQDDESNPQVAVQLLNGTIARHVPIVIGSSLAASCEAMAPIAANGPFIYCLSGGVQPAKGSYMFTYGSTLALHIPVALRYFRERGVRKVAILATTDASGKDAERNMDAALGARENRALRLVAREYFSPRDVSVAAQVAKIKASAPDLITLWTIGTTTGIAFRALQDAGLDVPVLMSGANTANTQMKAFEAILPKELYVGLPPVLLYDDLPSGRLKSAIASFGAAMQAGGLTLDIPYAGAYDAAQIVFAGLKKVGLGATSLQMKDFVSSLHGFTGANGEYDFRDGSQRGLREDSVSVVRWDPNRNAFVAVSKLGGMPR